MAVKYEYNKSPFNKTQQEYIDLMIKLGVSDDRLDILTQLDENDKPLFGEEYLAHFYYNLEHGVAEDHIEYCATTNKEGKLVYDITDINLIAYGFLQGLSYDQIHLYSVLDSDFKPIYNSLQKEAIIDAICGHFSQEKINLVMRRDTNDKPIFSSEEMFTLNEFFRRANYKQFNYIKGCIESNVARDKVLMFANVDIPADNMRILCSLSGLPIEYLGHLINENYNVNELKDIKYLMSCAKCFRLNIVDVFENISHEKLLINETHAEVADLIIKSDHCKCYSSIDNINMMREMVAKKMPPEQIDFIVNSGFSYTEMRNVAIGLLSGANFDKYKNDLELAKNILNDIEPCSYIIDVFNSEIDERDEFDEI